MYQQPPAPPPAPPIPPAVPVARGNWMAVTALVIGLVSLLLAFLPIINNFAFVLALAGLGFAIAGWVASRGGRRRGKGMSIASVILAVLAMADVIASQAYYANALDELGKELERGGYVPAPGESGSGEGGAAGAAGGAEGNEGGVEGSANDAAKDVRITSCETQEFGGIGGEVKIVNSGSEPRSYLVTAEAVRGSERLAELHASADQVRPGQSASVELFGVVEGEVPESFKCRIVSVDVF